VLENASVFYLTTAFTCAMDLATMNHAHTTQIGTAQIGTAQIGTAQIGTAQIGTAQIGTARPEPRFSKWSVGMLCQLHLR
jgi:hypothetical protein